MASWQIRVRNVQVRDLECDEVWGHIGKKQKRVRPEDDQNLGSVYRLVAIERHSKLVLNIAMEKRDQATTGVFIEGGRPYNFWRIHKSLRVTPAMEAKITDTFGGGRLVGWMSSRPRPPPCDQPQTDYPFSTGGQEGAG